MTKKPTTKDFIPFRPIHSVLNSKCIQKVPVGTHIKYISEFIEVQFVISIWVVNKRSPHGGMEIVTTLLSRGWWFDPRHWQSEKLLSGWKFMASPTSSPSARSLCYKVRNSPFNTWVSATILMAYSAHCENVKIFYHFPMKVWKYLAYTKGFLNNIKQNIKFNIGHSIKSTATWGRQILV